MEPATQLTPESLAALVDASAAINSAQDLDATLDAIARSAAAVLRAEATSVILLDAARGKQVFRAAVGDSAHQVLGLEYDRDAGVSGRVIHSGEAVVVNDVAADPGHFKEIDRLVGFETRSLLAAPLRFEDRVLGAIEVLNPVQGGRFGEPDRQVARVFANLAAIAVANSQLREQLRKDNRGLRQAAQPRGEMIGDSPAMRQVKELILRVAPATATVLLTGETGTGKELAARMIHANSPRAARPFIAVNCAALPATLLESELFGHEAGAFTGATGRKQGRFELADGGTIFLDEVAEVPPDSQVKLLRVLQEKEFVRVGGTTALGCDVRVIAATNRTLAEEIAAGRFREDLFYRLNVFPIEMPPLRDRVEDLAPLARHILARLAGDMKVPAPTLSPEVLAVLSRHDFPGNVRELENVLERACLLCAGREDDEAPTIRPEHLPAELGGGPTAAPREDGESALAASEKALITAALRDNGWNQTRAAAALGVSRDNIRYRIKKYGIRRAQ